MDEEREQLLASVFAGEAGFVLPLNSTSNVYESFRVVKSGQGILLGFSGYNSNSGTQFILGFDANQVPADGAVPIVIIAAPGSSNFSADFGSVAVGSVTGRAFRAGLVLCNSSTGPTKTIGSADCWFDVQYV